MNLRFIQKNQNYHLKKYYVGEMVKALLTAEAAGLGLNLASSLP